jgi:hypothetical protein
VQVAKWAGVGALRYIPEYLMDKKQSITEYISHKTNESRHEENQSDNKDLIELVNSDKKSISNETEINSDLEKSINEINEINKEIVKKLQTHDGAFSLGEADDGLCAVKFGMVKELEAIGKLANEVQLVGKEVEESFRFLEKMNEVIRSGIEKANQDLKKEHEKILQQEVSGR